MSSSSRGLGQNTRDGIKRIPDGEDDKSHISSQARDNKRPKHQDSTNDDDDMTPAATLSRRCFVTIGATAGFRQLLAEIIQPEFLKCLSDHGFDVLDVQCGPDHPWFEEHTKTLDNTQTHGIQIRSFEYTKNIQDHMLACRNQPGVRQAGCVISHAGSGTILEALRYEVPLVVVPNPTLMDNHQAELAEECEAQKWAVYGRLGKLPDAISRSQELVVQSGLNDLAPYSPPPFPVPESERVTLFDWMVLTCYPEELAKQQHLRDLRSVTENFQHEQAPAGHGIKDHGKLIFD